MKFHFGKLETEVSSSFRRKASERELPGFKHMAVAARRNMLTGAWKLLKRVKCAGALVVPAQASSCREESPDRSVDFKQIFAIYSLWSSSGGGQILDFLQRSWWPETPVVPARWHSDELHMFKNMVLQHYPSSYFTWRKKKGSTQADNFFFNFPKLVNYQSIQDIR